MPRVPSTGQINVKGIFSELNEDDYTAQNIDGETNVSFTKLTNGTYATINTDGWSDSTNNTSGETGSGIASQPHELSEWRGYDHTFSAFSWGSPTTPSVNVGTQYDVDAEHPQYGDAIAAQTFVINHNVSSKTITWYGRATTDDNTPGLSYQTDSETITYSGTLSSLDIRFAFVNIDFNSNSGYTNQSTYSIAADNNGILLASACSAISSNCTGSTSQQDISSYAGSSNQTFNSNWMSIGTDNGVNKSIILWAGATGQQNEAQGPNQYIRGASAGDTINVQLRANGQATKVVTLYSKTADINMTAIAYDEDAT